MTHENDDATPQHFGGEGLSLAQYAEEKALPPRFLKSLGIKEFSYLRKPALQIPYFDEDNQIVAMRFRIGLYGPNKFRWRKNSKPCLYGQDRLSAARAEGYILLVEGESDCHTLWHHKLPAIGIPGANTWKEERDAQLLDSIPEIFVLIEPDRGGESVIGWLKKSKIRERVKLVTL